MQMNSKKAKLEFQRKFLERAGQNFMHVKRMMDALPNVGFYIKDVNDRIVTLNVRNCEISALKDEFDAIGRKSSDLFPERIGQECLARDALVRKTGKPVVGGINYATVDRSPKPHHIQRLPPSRFGRKPDRHDVRLLLYRKGRQFAFGSHKTSAGA